MKALRSVFQDRSSDYEVLVKKAGKTTLYNGRPLNIVVLVYKALNNLAPLYIKRQFQLCTSDYKLRGTHIFKNT